MHIFKVLTLLLASIFAVGPAFCQPPLDFSGGHAPVLLYAYGRFSDYVNLGVTEDRLRRVIGEAEAFEREHPQAGLKPTLLFSGAVADALSKQNRKTHILDFVLEARQRGVVEIGYDGTYEPTPGSRPEVNMGDLSPTSTMDMPMLNRARRSDTRTPQQLWNLRLKAAQEFLTQSRDVYGRVIPGKAGGLLRARQVFGDLVSLDGLTTVIGHDSEMLHQLQRMDIHALVFGFTQKNEFNLSGYAGSLQYRGQVMSPAPNTSPDLGWINGYLWSSEASDRIVHTIYPFDGDAVYRDMLKRMSRDHIRVLHLELGDERMSVTKEFARSSSYPAVHYAYIHPSHPMLPGADRLERRTVDDNYAGEASKLKWFADEYFSANAGSRFISASEIEALVLPESGFALTAQQITAGAAELFAELPGSYTPNYAMIGGHYISTAELFRLLVLALAPKQRPEREIVWFTWGPLFMTEDEAPTSGQVTVAEVKAECTQLAPRFRNSAWMPLPGNAVPTFVEAGGTKMTAGHFLRLMLEAMKEQPSGTKLTLQYTHMWSSAGDDFPRNVPRSDMGETWTMKPAELKMSVSATK